MKIRTSSSILPALLFAAALFASSCGDKPSGESNQAANADQNPAAGTSASNEGAASANLDAEIERLEKHAERSPGDDSVREDLANAYVRRGNALRGADNLMGALKDYRSALQYNPDNEEAQKNAAELTPQVEGEKTGEYGEPAPLPITPNVTEGEEEPTPTKQPPAHNRRP